MCLWASFKKKYEKDYSFCILKKEPDPELNPDPYARGTDPGIRIQIRTKMSRFANTRSTVSLRVRHTTVYVHTRLCWCHTCEKFDKL